MSETFATTTTKVKTAVISGRHPYDVPAFQHLFRSIEGIDFYPQHLEDFVADVGKVRTQYDVLIFYNFHQDTPTAQKEWGNTSTLEVFEQLGETPQGILVLHHALLAWKQWPLWNEVTGVSQRSFGYYPQQALHVQIADPAHPITQGMRDFDLVDETYTMPDAQPENGNHILLTVEHPRSMRTLGWTRQYRQSRVLCWESGHDGVTFANPNFRTLMARGIHWLAGRL
jgi:type 1 glutamine amidotransferase